MVRVASSHPSFSLLYPSLRLSSPLDVFRHTCSFFFPALLLSLNSCLVLHSLVPPLPSLTLSDPLSFTLFRFVPSLHFLHVLLCCLVFAYSTSLLVYLLLTGPTGLMWTGLARVWLC